MEVVLHKHYTCGAELLVTGNYEVHMTPGRKGFIPPSGVKDFLKLRKRFNTLYTKHAVVDEATPKFNARLGLREVKRDFAFVYYQTT